MSHFSVAVFFADNKQSAHKLLAPFNGNTEVSPYFNGCRMTARNPQAKWVSYKIGGRWRGIIKLKNRKGIKDRLPAKRLKGYYGAFARDIDFKASPFITHAVITPDGEWHSPGTVNGNFFGIRSVERQWNRCYNDCFIKQAIKNKWYILIADCSI